MVNNNKNIIIPRNKPQILLLRAGNVGDMLMITPVMKALAKEYPHSTITLLTSVQGKELFISDPFIHNAYCLKHKHLPYFISMEKQKIVKTLKEIKFDTIINFETNPLFTKIIKKIKAKNTIGWSDSMSIKIPFDKKASYWKNCLNLLSPLGINESEPYLHLYISKDDDTFISEWLKKENIRKPIIGIHPGNSRIGKNRNVRAWLLERFAELTARLQNKFPQYEIVLTYKGDAEKQLIDTILSETAKITSLQHVKIAPQMTPNQFTSLLSQYKLLITTDTGTVNFAAVAGTPMVVLWGPGNFELAFPPLKENKTKIIFHRKDCNPCYGTSSENKCGTNECMSEITVDEVFNATAKIICD